MRAPCTGPVDVGRRPTMLPDALTAAGGDRGILRSGLHGLIVALSLLMVSAAALVCLPQARSEVRAEPIAILFPPWIARAEAVARSFAAGHRVLRSGRLPAIVVVAPKTMTLRTHGAAEQLQETAAALAAQAHEVRQEVAAFCGRVAAA